MNLFISSDLAMNLNTVQRVHALLHNDRFDLTRCTVFTTDSLTDRQFVEYALRMGAELKIIAMKSFLTERIVSKLSEQINFLIICSTMDNSFYNKLFKECDLKKTPIRLIVNTWHKI